MRSTLTQQKKNRKLSRHNQATTKMIMTKIAIVAAMMVTLTKKVTMRTAKSKTKKRPQSDKTLSI